MMPKKFLALSLGLLAAAALPLFAATPSLASGPENWQAAFSDTGVFPSTGQGFGSWGWCAVGGGVTSGNNGDCEMSQYFDAASGGGFTCEESLNITSWDASGGTFVITGTATVQPASETAECLAFFPGSSSFTGVNTGIPAASGHYNLGAIGTLPGEFQVQVTQVAS